ncbi:MAG: uroporphyrinogen decarboxylase family protein [Candidatus Poribacteria bacterium]
MSLPSNAQLALDTILHKQTKGIPTWLIHIMQHNQIERLAGAQPGDYKRDPENTYLAYLRNVGVCSLDQYIPTNPLTMGDRGYEGTQRGATTGAEKVIVDGVVIDSPEAVVEHLEKYVFPAMKSWTNGYNEDARVKQILDSEMAIQQKLGDSILKTGYGFIYFPHFRYTTYGYENYLMAYALYPDVMEKDFSLQADFMLLNNKAAARAYKEGNLPPVYRLDHDMADSRGTLVNIKTLDKIWFPHFTRCLEPMLKTDVQMIWHCDGNLMEMVPRLLDVGLKGFQGFQYECGMDYKKICKMKTKEGNDLLIIAGVSVTTTLPLGTPDDIRKQMKWLVDNGPKTGLFLAGTSSITPGVPWENIETFVEGLNYYRVYGRG